MIVLVDDDHFNQYGLIFKKYSKMKNEKLKPHQLFDDLVEKQRIVKANRKITTLEEARAKAKWIKEGNSDKKQRPDLKKND